MWCTGSLVFYLSHSVSDNICERLGLWGLFLGGGGGGAGTGQFASQETESNIPALGGPCGRHLTYTLMSHTTDCS